MSSVPPYEPQTHLFTSREEIFRLFSREGVELHLDDLHDECEYLNEVCERATRQVMGYLGTRYPIDLLAQDIRLREIATYWACYKISQRRGNPPIFEADWSEGQEDLERIREGTLYLNVPTNGPRASMQSQIVDNRFSLSQLRILPEPYGSSYTHNNQRKMYIRPWIWL